MTDVEHKDVYAYMLANRKPNWQSKRDIYIFGTGAMGQRAYHALYLHWNILGFIDNDTKKHGNNLFGLGTYSVDILAQPNAYDGVIIASQHYAEIANQLVELGIPEAQLIVPDFTQSKWTDRAIQSALWPFRKASGTINTVLNRVATGSSKSLAIFALNPKSIYSGGRYAAFMLAETACALGYNVYYITNHSPDYLRRGMGLNRNSRLEYCISKEYDFPRNVSFDVVFTVPHLGKWNAMYEKAIACSILNRSRLMFLNFETPNWFNEWAPEKRMRADWLPWLHMAANAHMICSISRTGMKYAQDYYNAIDYKGIHSTWHPPINSRTADRVQSIKYEGKRTIICITRIEEGHAHKGAKDLLEIISPEISGAKLQIVLGRSCKDVYFIQDLEAKANRYDVIIEWLHRISDDDKFHALYNARALLFLSYFEGYGYPPLEALYCNTPCVTYDLPVLRETCGDSLIYVPIGDTKAIRYELNKLLSHDAVKDDSLSKSVKDKYSFKAACDQLCRILDVDMEIN
jgi:glycosyltransferase involved in cell wall biosynthesis